MKLMRFVWYTGKVVLLWLYVAITFRVYQILTVLVEYAPQLLNRAGT